MPVAGRGGAARRPSWSSASRLSPRPAAVTTATRRSAPASGSTQPFTPGGDGGAQPVVGAVVGEQDDGGGIGQGGEAVELGDEVVAEQVVLDDQHVGAEQAAGAGEVVGAAGGRDLGDHAQPGRAELQQADDARPDDGTPRGDHDAGARAARGGHRARRCRAR